MIVNNLSRNREILIYVSYDHVSSLICIAFMLWGIEAAIQWITFKFIVSSVWELILRILNGFNSQMDDAAWCPSHADGKS